MGYHTDPNFKGSNWETKATQLAYFDAFMQAHPQYVTKQQFGTYRIGDYGTGNPAPMYVYRIGNPNGGKVLFDCQIHGTSDADTYLFYYLFRDMFAGTNPILTNYLNKKCILYVPIVNWNVWRKNDTPDNGAVDLNRNFPPSWSSAGSTNPADQYYHGASPASEPESQALMNLWQTEKPVIYVNHHCWGGPYFTSHNANATQKTLNDQIAAQYQARATAMGQPVYYPYTSGGLGAGMAAAQAAVDGCQSFLIEISNYADGRPADYSIFETYYYPRWLPFIMTMIEQAPDAIGGKHIVTFNSSPIEVPFLAPPMPNVLIQEGFEAGNAGTLQKITWSGSASVLTASPFAGTYHANFKTNAVSGSCGAMYRHNLASPLSELYARAYLKLNGIPTMPVDNDRFYLLGAENATTPVAYAGICKYTDGIFWQVMCRTATGTYKTARAASPLPLPNVYNCLEMRWVGSTSGGTYLYLNDVLIAQVTGDTSVQAPATRVEFGNVTKQGSAFATDIDGDNFVVSTSHIGKGGFSLEVDDGANIAVQASQLIHM